MEFDFFAEVIKMSFEQRRLSVAEFPGVPVYIPKMTTEARQQRDDEIRHLYFNCKLKPHEIAIYKKLSVRQISRILKE